MASTKNIFGLEQIEASNAVGTTLIFEDINNEL